MSTAKNIIFIGLYLENCCLEMGWGRDKNLVGVFFLVWGMSKFLLVVEGGGRGRLPCMENLLMCYFWVYLIHRSCL